MCWRFGFLFISIFGFTFPPLLSEKYLILFIMSDAQFRFYVFSTMFILFDIVAIGFTYSIIKQLYFEAFH